MQAFMFFGRFYGLARASGYALGRPFTLRIKRKKRHERRKKAREEKREEKGQNKKPRENDKTKGENRI